MFSREALRLGSVEALSAKLVCKELASVADHSHLHALRSATHVNEREDLNVKKHTSDMTSVMDRCQAGIACLHDTPETRAIRRP